jgi:hypothetical protein
MTKVSEVELDRIRTYGFRPLDENRPFEPQYAEPKIKVHCPNCHHAKLGWNVNSKTRFCTNCNWEEYEE